METSVWDGCFSDRCLINRWNGFLSCCNTFSTIAATHSVIRGNLAYSLSLVQLS